MADTEIIPVIDLGPYLTGAPGAIDRVAAELRFALTEIGFYFIVNHGVPPALVRDVFRQAERFHAQPLERKLAIKIDKHDVGYLPMKGDTLRTSTVATVTKPNLNEALFVARDLPSDHPDYWPIGAFAAPTAGRPICRVFATSSSTIATRWSGC
jgi:isopenicillin N synthase-like dioxygenase